jgi:hypothetical protein
MLARALNGCLGLWLFASAFLWRHQPAQLYSAWLTGIVVVTMAVLGLSGVRWARLVNMAAGGWLLITNILWRTDSWTFWNHFIVGLALAVLGAAPSLTNLRRRGSVRT